jgi:amidase
MAYPVVLQTVGELQAAMGRGDVTSVELVEASLAQIERHNDTLNAVVALRAGAALLEAKQADAVERSELGPLHGVPILIKDLNELTDLPTTFGSRAFAGNMASLEATVVTRLRAAGAIVVGRTNTPEFGLRPTTDNALFGPTRNPFDTQRNAGGSSGGAAAALAAGMVPVALGGDGGGSCRIPASCCGVVGFKPSRGLVPWAPVAQEYWGALATNGPMARSVDDAQRMLQVIAGPVPGEPYGVPTPQRAAVADRGLRIGWSTTAPHGHVDPEVAATVAATADRLSGLGHHVEQYELDLSGLYDPWLVVVEASAAMTVDHMVGDAGLNRLEANTLALALRGKQRSAADYAWAIHSMRNRSGEIMAAAQDFDILLTPTLTHPAPLIDLDLDRQTHEERWRDYLDWLAFTYPINCTGQPAISIPGGRSSSGLPIGVQLIGRIGDDLGVLHVARQLESAQPWRETYNRYGD